LPAGWKRTRIGELLALYYEGLKWCAVQKEEVTS
jgi:hypothetical protein